jgi:hypothetical protein
MEAQSSPIDDSEDTKIHHVQYSNFEALLEQAILDTIHDTRDGHDDHTTAHEHRPPSKCYELGTIECRIYGLKFQRAF